MVHRPSKVDKLPPEIRELISELRQNHGWTLDQIMDALRQLASGTKPPLPISLPPELASPPLIDPDTLPSRSGLGLHVQGLGAVAEELRRQRMIAEALVRPLNDAPESRQARVNIEMMHALLSRLMMPLVEQAATGQTVTIEAQELYLLSKGLDHLTRAMRTDAQTTLGVAGERRKVQDAEQAKMQAAGGAGGLVIEMPSNGRA